ncbi:hypothetical protein A9Q84_12490 [Halobacteriovorax marinus]|uniref:Cyclic nucleotide-binding domain-containing protein n=1 Tax=Halobacteriovorax marinus TaxID=97084 RepID=A0A1Y5F8B0_9BACT|nr:hypothetical protein A9Q84_12490 [Halobacteriovorax marinus]
MNTDKDYIKISKEFISILKELSHTHSYSSKTNLFYAGQTPIVAYLLLEGFIHLTKNKKTISILDAGTLLGFKELMNNEQVDADAYIVKDTKVCFLDKSTIYEIFAKGPNAPLYSYLKDLLQLREKSTT